MRSALVAISASAALTAASHLSADTIVGGPILANTSWTLAGSPYNVQTSIIIGANATLTIQPGTTVKVAPGLGITVGSNAFGPGALVALGTPANPIHFTSNVGFPGAPAPGDWKDISFSPFAVDAVYDGGGNYLSGSVLKDCIVEFAGSGPATNGAVTIDSSSPFITATEIRNNKRAGIYATVATAPALRVTNCDIHDNSPSGQPGGIFIDSGVGHVVTGNSIHDNTPTSSNGVGVAIQGASNVVFTGNSMQNNVSPSSNGGGIYGSNLASLTFTNNMMSGNSASSWGGAYLSGTNVTAMNNTCTGNTASAGEAGGMYLSFSGTSTFNGNVVTGNTANGGGGGLRVSGSGMTLNGNTITNNMTLNGNGGGMYIDSSSTMFINNTVDNNDAIAVGSSGGGIFHGGSTTTFSANTINGNSTGSQGGGLWLQTTSTVSGNEIKDNTAGQKGGGVYVNSTNNTFTSNQILDNHATSQGGGLFNNGAGTSLSGDSQAGTYNTIVGNTATLGPAVYHNVAFQANGSGDLPAAYVCWGTNDLGVVQMMVFDFFDDASKGIAITFPLVPDCLAIPGDLNNDGHVDGADLGLLLGGWGPCGDCNNCPGDLDGNCTVDGADLGLLLGNWG
ncbi:MAG: right-handed parallel beta-helix repeat-containing protein [Phycisphaerales bacterium]